MAKQIDIVETRGTAAALPPGATREGQQVSQKTSAIHREVHLPGPLKTNWMELELTRRYFPKGCNGRLCYKNRFVCYTIELPWLNNKPQHSCIPEGQYRLVMRYSRRHKAHFKLEGVKDRALILIHPANDALKELKGCIAPVTSLTGEGKGNLSRYAFDKLKKLVLALMDKGPVLLTIKS